MDKSKGTNKQAQYGRQGGKKGGPARAKALSPAERSKIAKMGGKARHKGKDTK